MIIRQSSLGVSMCPMLAWEREDRGLELQAGKGLQLGPLASNWLRKQCMCPKTLGLEHDPVESEAGTGGLE